MNLRIAAAGSAALLIATTAHADPDPAALERVEVIGSRLPRIDAETALPVRIIRRAEIERSGVATVEELLDRVSANFNGLREATTGAHSDVSGFAGASLRGLGSAETLVLLNGRRLANYAFNSTLGQGVDLHAIPLAAIDRVEVLKDGASAIYGSDAIAGVINFVTRRDFAGVEAAATATHTEAGGGNSWRATLAGGAGQFERDGYNALAVLDVRDADRLRGSDRPFSSTTYRPELGQTGKDPRTFPANVLIPIPAGGLAFVNPAAPACSEESFALGTSCRYNSAITSDLLPSSRQVGLFARGTLRVTPSTEAYAEIVASSGRIVHEEPPTGVSTASSQNGTPFVLPASSPYYPTGLGLTGDIQLAYRTVPLGPSTTRADTTNVRILAGVETRQLGWDLDSAVAVNRSGAREHYLSGLVDAGRLSSALATGLVNPFGPSGAQGEALLAGTEVRGLGRVSAGRTLSADLRGSREIGSLPGGPLGLAIGIEVRHESLDDRQLPIVADLLDNIPAAPKSGSRSAQAGYVEAVAPVLKGVELQAAARVDRYSDFGTTTSPKLALRVEPASWLVLRGSVGRGFRAPSLPELFTLQAHGFLPLAIVNLTDPVRCPVTQLLSDCQPGVDVVSGGNPALRPQRSTQTSVGVVVTPAPGWLASLDVWSIRMRDTIGTLDLGVILENLERFDGTNVQRGPVDPAFPSLPGPLARIENTNQNLGERQVGGTDVSIVSPPQATPIGRVSARLDGTYVSRARQIVSPGNEIDLVGDAAPRWQHVMSLNLDRERWLATVSYRYRRGYDDFHPLPDHTRRRVASYQLWDAQALVRTSPTTQLLFGVQNLFDRAPPFSNVGDPGYNTSYGDPRGRRFTIGLKASWT